jgi:Ser-tRNA(Ala) deacylase AlaX
MATKLLYYTDSYRRDFASEVVAVDDEALAVALRETAFFPTGGGQPHDTGTLAVAGATQRVVDVKKEGSMVWHVLAPEAALPRAGDVAHGQIDWERRYSGPAGS